MSSKLDALQIHYFKIFLKDFSRLPRHDFIAHPWLVLSRLCWKLIFYPNVIFQTLLNCAFMYVCASVYIKWHRHIHVSTTDTYVSTLYSRIQSHLQILCVTDREPIHFYYNIGLIIVSSHQFTTF